MSSRLCLLNCISAPGLFFQSNQVLNIDKKMETNLPEATDTSRVVFLMK